MTEKRGDAAKAPPVAKLIAKSKPLFRTIELEYPVDFDGTVYETITVRRMTGEEVRLFIEGIEVDRRLPMFDVPSEVIGALDADDAEQINKAVMDFLPRALREDNEPSPNTGASTQGSQPQASADKA